MATALICAERIRLQQRATNKEGAIRAACLLYTSDAADDLYTV